MCQKEGCNCGAGCGLEFIGYGDHGEPERERVDVDWDAHKAENERIRASGYCYDCDGAGEYGWCDCSKGVLEWDDELELPPDDFTPRHVLEAKLRKLVVDLRALNAAYEVISLRGMDRDSFQLIDLLFDATVRLEHEILDTLDQWEQL